MYKMHRLLLTATAQRFALCTARRYAAVCGVLVGGIGHHPGAFPGRGNATLTEPTSSHGNYLTARRACGASALAGRCVSQLDSNIVNHLLFLKKKGNSILKPFIKIVREYMSLPFILDELISDATIFQHG